MPADIVRNHPKAIIFIGLQASGKSTFYQQHFAAEYVHINLDTLHTRNKEALLLEDCIKRQISFVVDNTNPTIEDRKRYIQAAKKQDYIIEGYFFQSILLECIERNSLRMGKACIPNKAIACTSNQLELPSYQEEFDRLYFVHLQNGIFKVEAWKGEKDL